MTTTTEKYIKKAVAEAKKEFSGNTISDCQIDINMEADGATQKLAEALEAQAKANGLNSEAMLKLADALKPVEVYGIKVTQEGLGIPGVDFEEHY